MPIHVEVVAQDRAIFEEPEADMVMVPGIEGELGILPRHTPLLTQLAIGELRIKKGAQEEVIAVYGGLVEVRPDKVVVLANMAERADEIDLAKAEEARRSAQEMMEKGPPVDEAVTIAQELRHAELALKISRKVRSRAGSVRIRSDEDGE